MGLSTTDVSSGAVTAAALSRLWGYLRRAPQRTEAQELIARDAYIEGFRAGARWAVLTCGTLADPQFRTAINMLAEVTRDGADREPPLADVRRSLIEPFGTEHPS